MAQKFQIKFKQSKPAARGTTSFIFEKPPELSYRPGQNADYTLPSLPADVKGSNKRTFSFVSAPFEEHIEITTRLRDTAFKQTLRELKKGDPVELKGPYGDMLLHSDVSKPAAMLAGGIGITPFVSMIRQASHEKLPHKLFLFYANRAPEDAAFLDDLKKHTQQNPNFKLILTMSQADNSWSGERGYIDKPMLLRHLPALDKAMFYLAGPPAMVGAMHDMLIDADVPVENIRSEEFAGY